MKFDLPANQPSIIKVIGVGGGGSNAVNHMYKQGIKGVDFMVCNTDIQALEQSPVPMKFILGETLTEGLGAGSIPEVGKNAAIETIDEIKQALSADTKMVFVTAGMGGGTGTGAAPIIAKAAVEMGILTVGIVTVPFGFEGKKRRHQAEAGLAEMRDAVDTLLVINNDKLREMFGNLSLQNAFAQADDVLTSAAKGIAEVITVTGQINVDFEDVKTVMRKSGVAIMGSATAEGEHRALQAAESAIASPLLNDNDIKGARHILLNITYGDVEVLMDEITEITDYIQEEAGMDADIIWGHGYDSSLENKLGVTIIATGFKGELETGLESNDAQQKSYVSLDEDRPTALTAPITNPTQQHNTYASTSTVSAQSEEAPYIKSPEVETEVVDNRNVFSPVARAVESNLSQSENVDQSEEKNESAEKKYFMLDEEAPETQANVEKPSQDLFSQMPTKEEQLRKANDRISRIKELSHRLKTPSGISDLEKEPAYKRRNIQLDNVEDAENVEMSRFTLSEELDMNGQRETTIRPNNSFLHDNVD